LLLLDLKMPVLDGFEVLRWIRKHPTLSSLRVLVLTVSNRIQDVNHAYELGANSFLVKPTDFEQTVYLSNLIKEYWLRTDAGPTVRRPDRKKQVEGDRR
jgi:CheY-like chemotaxis protein